MKSATVNIKQIPAMEFRFDPSLHLSEGVKVRETLAELPYEIKPLSSVTERIFLGNIFSRIWVKDKQHGVPYLAASDTVLANLDTGQFLAKRQALEMPYLVLEKGWILVTCSGTLGNTSYTNSNYAGRIATHDLIRIVPNEDELPGGYIYAFLSSKYGYYQITQSQFGGVVKHINATQAGQIQIPILPKEIISYADNMIKEAASLREEANKLLQSAKSFFDERLSIKEKIRQSSSKSIQSILDSQNHRFEANYYISEGALFERLILDQFQYKPLSFFFKDISRPDIFKRMYVSEEAGLMFFGCSELFLATPKSIKFLSKRTPNLELLTLKEGWVLLPRSGTIGDVAYATSLHAQKLASEDVIRLKPDNILSGAYAYAFLSSRAGKAMLQRAIFGSVIQHIEPPMLKIIPVPIFEDSYDGIANQVITASKKLGRAGQLELEAISLVEAEIEKWNK